MDKANLLKVKRPDGMIVWLTCTPAQFEEVWQPRGYKLAGKRAARKREEVAPSEAVGDDETTQLAEGADGQDP